MKTRLLTPLLRKSGLVLAFSALSSLPLVAADPATILPDDSVAYMEMDSAGFYKLENHPVTKAIPVEKLKDLMYKMSGTSPGYEEEAKKLMAAELGMPYDELVKKFGRFAITVHDLKVPANPTPENVSGEISFAGEIDGDEAFMEKYVAVMFKLMKKEMEKQGKGADEFDKFLSKASEAFEQTTVEHGGAKVHVYKLKETAETKEAPAFVREWAWAVNDKMLFGGSGQEQVEEMLDRQKAGGDAGSLAASAYYKADHDKAGKSLGLASLNLEVILGLVKKYALPEEAGDIDIHKIWTVLGADKLRSAVVAMSATEDAVDVTGLLNYSEKPGLLSIFVIPGSGTAPAFLPKSLESAGYQQLDLGKTVDKIENLVTDMNPAWGGYFNMGLQMAESTTGVDIREEIINQLGPEMWSASSVSKDDAPAPDASDPQAAMLSSLAMSKGVFGVKVKDSKAFGTALSTLFNKAGGEEALFEKQEYQGFTIYIAKNVPEPMKIGYVLTDEWLILNIADQPALEQVLGRLAKPGDDSFFAQKDVSRHLSAMRGSPATVAVTDLGAAMKAFFTVIGTAAKSSGAPQEFPFEEFGKLMNVPLRGYVKAWIDPKHSEYRLRIAPKGE